MSYYILEPEVAGGLGSNTVMNRNVHPPVVSKLHYEFDGWLGDAIVTSFPCFLVTSAANRALEENGVTGLEFAEVELSTSEEFRELFPQIELPRFVWVKVHGQVGRDDFSIGDDGRLVVSQRALNVLESFGTSHAVITPIAV